MSRLQGPMSFGSWQTSGLELLVDDLVDMTVVGASPGQSQSLGQQELALWMGVQPRSTLSPAS